MVYWPGVTRPGSISKQYMIIQDFFPTLIEMTGIKNYKTVQKLDGQSIVRFLKNSGLSDNNRPLIWNFPNDWAGGNLGQDNSWLTAIRQGDWKLIYFESLEDWSCIIWKVILGRNMICQNNSPKKQKSWPFY